MLVSHSRVHLPQLSSLLEEKLNGWSLTQDWVALSGTTVSLSQDSMGSCARTLRLRLSQEELHNLSSTVRLVQLVLR